METNINTTLTTNIYGITGKESNDLRAEQNNNIESKNNSLKTIEETIKQDNINRKEKSYAKSIGIGIIFDEMVW